MRCLGRSSVSTVLTVALLTVSVLGFAPTASSSETLAAAARAGDLAQSRELIRAGAAVDLAEPDGSTPLLWAVYNISPELVQLLLAAGADPNQPNQLHITPLLQASRYGDAGMIKSLLGSGARLEAAEHGTEPPLLAAARAGSVAAVKVLLEAGADPNGLEAREQQSALMWAAAEGHLEVARALLDAGADPNRLARVSELSERKNADFPTGGFAALHWAARNGDAAMTRLLLDKGANINVRNGDSSTPMMLAIVNDRFDLAAELLSRGADPNDGSLYYVTEMRDGTTDWRAKDGTVFRADHPNKLSALDLTRLLLEAGADPNRPFKGQMHNTSMCCDIKVNATPFYRAAIAADVEGLQLMLAHGADTEWRPATEPKEGETAAPPAKTALMLAITGGKGVGVSGGPNDLRQGPPVFREQGNREPLDAVTVLLAAGADVHALDANQETALHLAARALHPGIVRALVAHGAALDAKNKDDWTPQQLVENTPPPAPNPGFYFQPPPAQPGDVIALFKTLAAESGAKAQ
jgi:uncharacterized protein